MSNAFSPNPRVDDSGGQTRDYSKLGTFIAPGGWQFSTGGVIIPAGSIPGSALAHGDYVDLTNAQTIGGAKTFTAALIAAALEVAGSNTNLSPAYTNLQGTVTVIGGALDVGNATITAAGEISTLTLFNVRTYGATGNGTTNDSAAIQAALAAANTQAASGLGAVLYFPPGHYFYNSATPLTILQGVTVFSLGDCGIYGGGSAINCFVYTSGFAGGNTNLRGASDYLPNILNFSGVALSVQTNVRCINVTQIVSCGTGIQLSSTASNQVLDNTIRAMYVSQCGDGVQVNGDSTGFLQGNIVEVNFVTGCNYGLAFRPGGVTYIASLNRFSLFSLDSTGATTTPNYGIFSANTSGGYIVECPNFFGGLTSAVGSPATAVTATTLTGTSPGWTVNQFVGWQVEMNGVFATVTSNTASVLTFSGGWSGATPATGAFILSQWIGVNTPGHTSVDYYFLGGSSSGLPYNIIGTLAANSRVRLALTPPDGTYAAPKGTSHTAANRAGYNGGVSPGGNILYCVYTTSGITAVGAIIDVYGYSCWLTNNTPVRCQVMGGNNFVVTYANDESGTTANQWHVQLTCIAATTGSTNINLRVEIGP